MACHIQTYPTAIGSLVIGDNGRAISHLMPANFFQGMGFICWESALIKQAHQQLEEYLQGRRRIFSIPLEPEGTPFQKRVWRTLQKIPYGETRTYGQIADQIGNPKACRAVGHANSRNPIMILIPCHRVIGSQGQLVGYSSGLDIKEKLLSLEKNGR